MPQWRSIEEKAGFHDPQGKEAGLGGSSPQARAENAGSLLQALERSLLRKGQEIIERRNP